MQKILIATVIAISLIHSSYSLKKATTNHLINRSAKVVSHLGLEGCSGKIHSLVTKIRD